MGMDVVGRNSSEEKERYFRASIWSWAPIHPLISELCSDLLPAELIEVTAFNQGQGPDKESTCLNMASRFEAWLRKANGGYTLPCTELRCTKDGRFLRPDELADPNVRSYSPYHVTREHLAESVGFLKHCGGFEVW